MSVKGYVVVLEENAKDEAEERILTALRQVRRAVSVKPVAAELEDHFAHERVKHELFQRVVEVFFSERKR